MNIPKEDLLLHPVRIRIILAVAGRGQVTAQQLGDELTDIPQATLYRHLNVLSAAGILVVAAERRSRSTNEKIYALQTENLFLTDQDLAQARPEDHVRLFTQFLGMLLGYFSRYAYQSDLDMVQDHVNYRLAPLYLRESEFAAVTQAMNAALAPFAAGVPAADRRRYILGFVTLPDAVQPTSTAGPQAGSVEVRSDQEEEIP